MKRIFLASACALLLTALPARAFNPCTDAAAYTPVEQRYTKGLLFKIEKCGSPVSYIFGTVHLDRPAIDAAAAGAFEVLKKVQAAAFELPDLGDPSDQVSALIVKQAYAVPGKEHTLSHLLGKDYFAKLVAELNFLAFMQGRVIQSQTLDRMRPWMAALAFETMGEAKGTPLDEKLWMAAILADKNVFGLETIEEQMQALSALPEPLQIRMLKETIDHYPDLMRAQTEMLDAYTAKDARKIQALEEMSLTGAGDHELDRAIRDRLIIKRNRIMEERLLPHLSKESVLVSVGLLHLPGKDGVLRLLEQDGYFITPMP